MTKSKKPKNYHLSGGWAWQPDSGTITALSNGRRKVTDAKKEREQQLFANQEHSHMTTANRITKGKAEDKAKKVVTKKIAAKKKVAAKKPAPKVKTKTKSSEKASNLIPLKKILPEGIDAKVARKKLRDAGLKGHSAKARWEFTDAGAKEALKILKAG